MDSSKAKKAKSKAESRKKQPDKKHANPHLTALARERQQQQAGALTSVTGGITPEVTAPQIALQTPTVNPYHMMGAMAPNMYSPGNVIRGGFVPGS